MKKARICLLFLLCGLLLIAALPVGAAVQGDLNGDNNVNIQDVSRLLGVISGELPDTDPEQSDVDGDGLLTIKDVTAILQIIEGVIIPKVPRLDVTVTADGLEAEVVNLPVSVNRASVLVLGNDVTAAVWKENLSDVRGIAQLAVASGSGSVFVPLADLEADYLVVVTYNGGQLVREVN